MLRGLLTSFNDNIKPHKSLYLNGMPYANINFGWLIPMFGFYRNGRITIGYETY